MLRKRRNEPIVPPSFNLRNSATYDLSCLHCVEKILLYRTELRPEVESLVETKIAT